MKILLIGGTGFIGTYLYQDLCTRYHVERTYANSFIEGGLNFNVTQHSIADLITGQYDVIINNINPSTLSYYHVAKLCEELGNACKKYNTWLINISSIFADETNKFNDSYSMKKHIIDEIIMVEMRGHKFSILRYPQIFDNSGLAKKSQGGFYFLLSAIKKREPLTLFANCKEMVRNYLPVDLLIDSINFTIDKKILGLHNVYVPAHTLSLRNIVHLLTAMNPEYDSNSMITTNDKTGIVYQLPDASIAFNECFHSVHDFKFYLSKTFHEYR